MNLIRQLTQFNFYQELQQKQGRCLVYFYADSCGSCKHLAVVLEQMTQQQPDITIFKVDAQQDQALVSEYEIFHLPSMFLFINGEFHAEIHAEARIPALLIAIDQASLQPAQEAP